MLLISVSEEYGYKTYLATINSTLEEFEKWWKTIDLSKVNCLNCGNILDKWNPSIYEDSIPEKDEFSAIIILHTHEEDDTRYDEIPKEYIPLYIKKYKELLSI
jgi:hypothetical protein